MENKNVPLHDLSFALSGGLDSYVLVNKKIYDALDLDIKINQIHLLNVDYGSRQNNRELAAVHNLYADIVNRFKDEDFEIIPHFINLPLQVNGQLNKDSELDQGTYEEAKKTNDVSPQYVNNRNGIFINLAAQVISENGVVYFGAHKGDNDHSYYPDTTPEYVSAMNKAIELATSKRIHVQAPFVESQKFEIVQIGDELELPLDLTYSCYLGESFHCGKCPACNDRKQAFKKAGVKDQTIYQN